MDFEARDTIQSTALYSGILLSNEDNEPLIHSTTWVNIKIIMIIIMSEINQTRRSTYCLTPFMQHSGNCKLQ